MDPRGPGGVVPRGEQQAVTLFARPVPHHFPAEQSGPGERRKTTYIYIYNIYIYIYIICVYMHVYIYIYIYISNMINVIIIIIISRRVHLREGGRAGTEA